MIEKGFRGESPRTMPVGGIAMEPDGGAGGFEGGHALGEQAGGEARQHIAGAGGGKRWRGIAVDRGAAIGAGDDRIGAFENDDRAGAFCGFQGALMFRFRNIGQIAEKAGEFAFVGGEDDGAVGTFGNCGEEFGGVLGEGGQGIGIENRCGAAGEDGAHFGAGFGADAGGGADADGIAALVVEEHAERQGIVGLRQHEGGGVGGVDKEFILVARDGDEPCPDFQGGLCGKARCAGVELCAGDNDGMAAFVFVGGGIEAGENGFGVFPELGFHFGENGFRDADVSDNNFAAEHAAGQQEVGGFLAEKSDGEIGFDAGAARVSRQAIKAGGNINGDDGNAGVVYFVGQMPRENRG